MRSDQLMMIGVGIIIGGLMLVFYLASIFGTNLPGWTMFIPILTGGGCLLYSIRLPDEQPIRKEDSQ